MKGAGPRPGDKVTSKARGQSKIGKPGTNLEPVAQKPYTKVGTEPKVKGYSDQTKSSNPPTDKAMIASAHKAAKTTGIDARFGGNCGRKMDIASNDDAALMRAAKANSSKAR